MFHHRSLGTIRRSPYDIAGRDVRLWSTPNSSSTARRQIVFLEAQQSSSRKALRSRNAATARFASAGLDQNSAADEIDECLR